MQVALDLDAGLRGPDAHSAAASAADVHPCTLLSAEPAAACRCWREEELDAGGCDVASTPTRADAIFEEVVGASHPLHTWAAGGAGARRRLRGVCRGWAARLAELCVTVHVSGFWLPAAAEALSTRPARFPRLSAVHVFVALLPTPHARAAMRCMCTPLPVVAALWRRCDVVLELSVDSSGAWLLDDATLSALAVACPRLRQLKLQRSPGGRPRTALVAPVLSPCRALTCIDLSASATLTDAAVGAIARACPQLRSVALASCSSLECPQLRGAALQELDLSYCSSISDGGVETLLALCPALRRLSLAMRPCPMRTGTCLRAPRIASASLQHLDMRGIGDALAPSAWLAVLANCPSLLTLRGFPEPLLRSIPHADRPWIAATRAHGGYVGLLLRSAVPQ